MTLAMILTPAHLALVQDWTGAPIVAVFTLTPEGEGPVLVGICYDRDRCFRFYNLEDAADCEASGNTLAEAIDLAPKQWRPEHGWAVGPITVLHHEVEAQLSKEIAALRDEARISYCNRVEPRPEHRGPVSTLDRSEPYPIQRVDVVLLCDDGTLCAQVFARFGLERRSKYERGSNYAVFALPGAVLTLD
jgi:hypothetical protein